MREGNCNMLCKGRAFAFREGGNGMDIYRSIGMICMFSKSVNSLWTAICVICSSLQAV